MTSISEWPITSPLDLRKFLSVWAAEMGETGQYLGNTQPVEELVRILQLGQPDTLLRVLGGAHAKLEIARANSAHQERPVGGLPLTLSTYLLHQILFHWPKAGGEMNEELRSRTGDELLRYKIRVLRDSFVWLSDLVERQSDWVDLLMSGLDANEQHRMIGRLTWLSRTQTREFCERPATATPLTEDGKSALENLWGRVGGNSSLPIQIAFSLARLRAKGQWSNAWAKFSEVARLLR